MLQVPKPWLPHIGDELEKDYIKKIDYFLCEEMKAGKTIYPKQEDIFNAFKYTDFNDVQVVILGQDPYHGAGQAHGLSFSVSSGVKVPPSLRNIYKELENEFEIKKDFTNGNLEHWAKQGILLLNSVLTVEASKPASHSKIGWQEFTNSVIQTLSNEKKGVVFLLWGAYAIGKQNLIDSEKHLVLTSPHPSPFSVYKGFYRNNHFVDANKYLNKNGDKEIVW